MSFENYRILSRQVLCFQPKCASNAVQVNAIMDCTRCSSLDPVDVHPGSLVELVIELFLLALVVCDASLVDCHLSVGSCGAALGQSARVDDKHTVNDLKIRI